MGFLPLRLAPASIDDSGFGVTRFGGSIASGAEVNVGWHRGVVGLSLECELEHLFGEDLSKGDNGVFEFGECGAPFGAVGSPDAIDEIFCHAFEIGSNGGVRQ